jgi:hypothetical protein
MSGGVKPQGRFTSRAAVSEFPKPERLLRRSSTRFRDARTTFLPTILWRLLGRDGTRARAMLVPNARTCTLVWWFDDIQPFACELSNWDEALALADELRAEFQAREFIDMQ